MTDFDDEITIVTSDEINLASFWPWRVLFLINQSHIKMSTVEEEGRGKRKTGIIKNVAFGISLEDVLWVQLNK